MKRIIDSVGVWKELGWTYCGSGCGKFYFSRMIDGNLEHMEVDMFTGGTNYKGE